MASVLPSLFCLWGRALPILLAPLRIAPRLDCGVRLLFFEVAAMEAHRLILELGIYERQIQQPSRKKV